MAFLFLSLLPVVAVLAVVLIAMTYVGGKVFRIPEWEAYFNVELYNVVFAVLTAATVLVLLSAVHTISASLLPGGEDPVDSAQAFLSKVVNKGVMPMYKDLLVIEAGTALSSAFMITVGPGVWSFTYKVEPGADAILSMSRMLGFGMLVIYASLSVQYILLAFVKFAAPIAMSIGILLFIFPPTKDAGSFLIAFSFAFQTIFPFTYALNYAVLNDMWQAHGYGSEYDAYTPELHGVRLRGISGVLSFLTPFASLLNFQLMVPFINAMAHLALISLFLPALSTSLTISFINTVTKFLVSRT